MPVISNDPRQQAAIAAYLAENGRKGGLATAARGGTRSQWNSETARAASRKRWRAQRQEVARTLAKAGKVVVK